MQILKPAVAGTLESSDLMVTLEPGFDGIELSLTSSVMNVFIYSARSRVKHVVRRIHYAVGVHILYVAMDEIDGRDALFIFVVVIAVEHLINDLLRHRESVCPRGDSMLST